MHTLTRSFFFRTNVAEQHPFALSFVAAVALLILFALSRIFFCLNSNVYSLPVTFESFRCFASVSACSVYLWFFRSIRLLTLSAICRSSFVFFTAEMAHFKANHLPSNSHFSTNYMSTFHASFLISVFLLSLSKSIRTRCNCNRN